MGSKDFKLKILFTNINSLKNSENFSALTTEINNSSPHVISLTETWIKPHLNSDLFSIPHYTLIRADRVVSRNSDGDLVGGGGVAAYFHNSLNFKVLFTSVTDDINKPDFLIIELYAGTSALLFSVIYRRPSGATLDDFGDVLDGFLSVKEYSHILMMGDFNYDIKDEYKCYSELDSR